jgi:hypothetical protein
MRLFAQLPSSQRSRGDHGVVLPFLAISLVALLAVAALVLDGGAAYAQRRAMQNAADAAAMAGAAALEQARFGGASHTLVQAEVERIALQNGAESVGCELRDATGALIAPCSGASAAQVRAASRVRALTESTRATLLGGIVGISSTTAPADATAAIQRVVGFDGARFAVCSAGGSYQILNQDNTINVAAARGLGKMALKAAQLYNAGACAGSSNFKGEIERRMLVIGEEVTLFVRSGNLRPEGWEQDRVPCPGDTGPPDCLLLPVIRSATGRGNNMTMTPVAWGYWRATEDTSGCYNPGGPGNIRLCGTFVAATEPGPLPPGVVFGDGDVSEGDIRRPVLIE